MDYVRHIAVFLVAAALIGIVVNPTASKKMAGQAVFVATNVTDFDHGQTPYSERECPRSRPVLTRAVANLDDVISISPLGGVTAPEEPLPAPHIRINTKRSTGFQRRQTTVFSPAKADIIAIERRIDRAENGTGVSQSWTVHFSVCQDIRFFLSDLDSVSEEIVTRAGGVKAFSEMTGPDNTAVETQIRVRAGDVIGMADGFDMGLSDFIKPAKNLVRPERYRSNPYTTARVLNTDASLIAAIEHDHTRAQCPLDYFSDGVAAIWSDRLGDSFGIRKAKGDNACRAAVLDLDGAAQGAWFTDASLNAAVSRVRAISLAPDTIDPARQIFALHGRLPSLSPDMINLTPKQVSARQRAARDFLTFEHGKGDINPPFALTEMGKTYCYDGLRANFVGPRVNGVVLLRVEDPNEEGSGSVVGDTQVRVQSRHELGARMRIEARADALSCSDLEKPWAFTGNETLFFR
ncbi:MAG: hypothetical protein AAF720_03835 [Pseudomonadota bacterium]